MKHLSLLGRRTNALRLLLVAIPAALPQLTQFLPEDDGARDIIPDALFALYAEEAHSALGVVTLGCGRDLGCIIVDDLGCRRFLPGDGS
jgi:hypothetical protein